MDMNKRANAPRLATREDDDSDNCEDRTGLMSELAGMRGDMTRIEERLADLAGVLGPLIEGGAPGIDADEDDDRKARELPVALSEIVAVRYRLDRIQRFVGELARRAQV